MKMSGMFNLNARRFAIFAMVLLACLWMGAANGPAAIAGPIITPVPPAMPTCACSCPGCDCGCCVVSNHNALRNLINQQHQRTREWMTFWMTWHQRWWFTEFFDQHVLPAEMMMSEQLTTVGLQQMEIVGALLDAKHQLESQRLFQQKQAEAHKDYHSSHGMCTFATMARSLSATDRRAELTTSVMTQRSLQRQLAESNASASDGPVMDHASRLAQFIDRYCDVHDANNTLEEICEVSSDSTTINKDIDYNRLIETPMTLQVDFSEGAEPEGDEADILAMGSNLFSNNMWQILPDSNLALYENATMYYDMRSLVAKRSVAEHSFNTIVGLKAQGSEEGEEAAGYAGRVLQQLGVPDDEVFVLLGERPSYFATMDIMAQKLYQRPEFYTDLYDKPANIARKDASMRAIELMVDRDIYKSDLRYETMLAVLLELELIKHQRRVQNRLADMTEAAKTE